MKQAILIPKAVLKALWEAEAPFRNALGIKSERKRWGGSGRPSKAASEICNRAQMSSSFMNARSTTRPARCGVCASRMLCVGGTHAHPLRHSFCATGSGSFSCGQIFGPFFGSLGKEFIILRDQLSDGHLEIKSFNFCAGLQRGRVPTRRC